MQGYPPKGPFVQFANDQLRLSDEVRNELEDKRGNMLSEHRDRLHHAHLAPVRANVPHFSLYSDAEDDDDEDITEVPRPTFLPEEVPLPTSDSDFEDANEPPSAELIVKGRSVGKTADIIAKLAANAASDSAQYMGKSLRNNVVGTMHLAHAGAQAGSQAVGALAGGFMNATLNVGAAAASAGAAASSAGSAALQPGSSTRVALSDAAGGVLSGAKAMLDVTGPPMILGGYLAKDAGIAVAGAAAGALVHTAKTTAKHLPAVGNALGSAAGAATGVVTGVATGVAGLLGKAVWTLTDVLIALDEASKTEKNLAVADSKSLILELDDEGRVLADAPRSRRKRFDSPPRRSTPSSSSSSTRLPKKTYEYSFKTPEDWLEHSTGKGFLAEQIYLRPGWGQLMGRAGANGFHTDDVADFRKKMLRMTPHDLATVLVHLDNM